MNMANTLTFADIWMENALEDVFRDTEKPVYASKTLELHMARNEYESGQVVIRSQKPLTNVVVRPSGLTGAGYIEPNCVSVKKVNLIHLQRNTEAPEEGLTIDPESRRREAPNYFPAYFSQESNVDIVADQSVSFWITMYVPSEMPYGEYTGVIHIDSDQGSDICYLKVHVYDVTLPQANESSAYNNTIWFISCGVTPGVERDDGTSLGTETQMKEIYGFDNFSDGWWELMENMAAEMGRYRQNCIYIPLYYLIVQDLRFDENSKYIFNWDKFDRYVQLFLDHGTTKWLEGHHFTQKRGNWDIPYSGWLFKENDDGTAALDWASVSSQRFKDHLEQLLTALSTHLSEKGWLSMYIQHCADEAITPDQVEDARELYRLVHSAAPHIRTIDACNKTSLKAFDDLLDIYVPRLDEYDILQNQFDALRDDGRELWFYTCCGPQENYLSRLEDYKLASTRLLPWYSFKFGLTGYLHWAYNLWCFGEKSNDPFAELLTTFGLPGDAWTVYPDVEGKSVLQSPRNEAMRDGIEEYELFKLFEKIDREAAHRLVRQIVKSATEHDKTASHILAVKVELLKGISGTK